ncbi:hypothetical protein CDAR_365151 [Caerostris darwini]|uniref:Uncharacterized protein n=1 Tax=Caerostris darwini TaxID=1538125 RepID=A0AAV4U1C3_9ARAC|nr:hypothetical protein CDAR_365151 [Caerostris darwini]
MKLLLINNLFHITRAKQQSKQWVDAGGSAPKKAKSIASARKVVASVFWDAKGILLINYIAKGKTITGEYYSNLPSWMSKFARRDLD